MVITRLTYIGFSWDIKGATKYLVFTVLSIGLSSAPFVFTKVVRPLVKRWCLHALKIAWFLDDGLGLAYTYQDALSCSNFVKTTLINWGFVPSIWIPCQRIICLSIEIDTNNNIYQLHLLESQAYLIKLKFELAKYTFPPENYLNWLVKSFLQSS